MFMQIVYLEHAIIPKSPSLSNTYTKTLFECPLIAKNHVNNITWMFVLWYYYNLN